MNPFTWFKPHTCVIVRQVGDSYVKIKSFKISNNKDSVSYGDKSYVIDFKQPAWRDGKKGVYLIDIDTGQLTFIAPEKSFPELADQIFERKIVSQLVSSLQMPGFSVQIIMILIGLVIGALLGYFAGSTFPAQEVFKR